MQKKNPAKRRPERLVVTLLSLLFLSTAVFATVKYVFRAPELDTDKPVVTPDGTASADVDRTDTDEPDAPGRTRRKYCYNILVSGLDDDNGGSDTNILVRFDVPNKRIDLVSLPRDTLLHNEYRNNKLNFAYAKGGTELLMEQIENLLGVPVDFYVTVNLKGFIALVDQIDGVDFDIPINMDYDDPYQDLHIHFATTTTAPATARRTSAASAPSRPSSRRSPSSCCRSATSRTSPLWSISSAPTSRPTSRPATSSGSATRR